MTATMAQVSTTATGKAGASTTKKTPGAKQPSLSGNLFPKLKLGSLADITTLDKPLGNSKQQERVGQPPEHRDLVSPLSTVTNTTVIMMAQVMVQSVMAMTLLMVMSLVMQMTGLFTIRVSIFRRCMEDCPLTPVTLTSIMSQVRLVNDNIM